MAAVLRRTSVVARTCFKFTLARSLPLMSYSSYQFSDSQTRIEMRRLRVKKVAPYLLDRTRPASEILAQLKPEDEKQLQLIRKEHQMLLSMDGHRVPETLDDKGLLELLCSPSASSRRKTLLRLYKKFMAKQKKYLKSAEKRQKEAEEGLREEQGKVTDSDLQAFRCMRRIPPVSMRKHQHSRLFNLMDFSQKLVLDMSFEDEMRNLDIKSLCMQISMTLMTNRLRSDPFHIVFSNLKRQSNQFHMLSDSLGVGMPGNFFTDLDDMPYTRSENCIISESSSADRRQFVYLTPDSPHVLEKWDNEKTYIIGGLVDKVNSDPVTLLKARRLRVEHARLPLEREMKLSRRSLNVDTVACILLSLKDTQDFDEALKLIPRRLFQALNRKDPLERLRQLDFIE